jgi:TolB-like protein
MIYRFGRFELDLARSELRADGEPRLLEPQVFALLAFLVENRERLVSRDELIDRIWDGRVVSDSAVSSRVKSLRKALDDDGTRQQFIRTLNRRGFRFVATVQVETPLPSTIEFAAPPPGALQAETPAGPVRPAIAVLPFQLVGNTGSHAMIGDALPHELIAELARLRWIFVTARGSSFRLRSPDPDVRAVGRLLNVQYCLTGTIEVTGAQLVVTTDLADTRSGRVIWAERYPGRLDDVHAVRSEICSQILTALEIRIPLHEAERARLAGTENLDAWSAYHLGLQHLYRFNRSDNALAASLFSRAIAQDPGFARAHAGLSFVHFQTAFLRQTNDIAGEIASARRLAQRGLDLDPLDPFVNFTMGRSYWLEGDLDRGLAWLERSTTLSPNYAQGIYARAWTETLAGRESEGRNHVDLAMRLSPLDPMYYAMLGTRAFTHIFEGDYEAAAQWGDRAARSPGAHVLIAMVASVAQSLAGNDAAASEWARQVKERNAILNADDFLRAFPMRPEPVRTRITAALNGLGF